MGRLMKRTELRRRSPMPRQSKPLPVHKPLQSRCEPMRRVPLNPVSGKRRAENRERTAALAPLRAAQPWCSRCGATGVALDAHELLSRARGGSITNLANIVLLCRADHTWVTEHPVEAAAEGWVLRADVPEEASA